MVERRGKEEGGLFRMWEGYLPHLVMTFFRFSFSRSESSHDYYGCFNLSLARRLACEPEKGVGSNFWGLGKEGFDLKFSWTFLLIIIRWPV